MFLLLTYHTLKDIFPNNPNIGIIADVAQILVYALALYMLWKCKRPKSQPRYLHIIFNLFIIMLPEIFITYYILTILTIGDPIMCPNLFPKVMKE